MKRIIAATKKRWPLAKAAKARLSSRKEGRADHEESCRQKGSGEEKCAPEEDRREEGHGNGNSPSADGNCRPVGRLLGVVVRRNDDAEAPCPR